MLNFMRRKPAPRRAASCTLSTFLEGCSAEVMPRTLAKLPEVDDLFPRGTRVYIAHIDGTAIGEMVATARRLRDAGYEPMPHIPARMIPDRATFECWVRVYAEEAGVTQALVLAGGLTTPLGPFESSMDLLGTGLFDRFGFRRLHVAGHPEGNRDIDTDGGEREAMKALAWKQALADRSDAEMAIVTQFVFDAAPVIGWARRLSAAGVTLPIHVGLAGPARLQTLIKYAVACGVGPSLSVLRKRAMDVGQLLLPYAPTELAQSLAEAAADLPNLAQAHLFPLGGISASADWLAHHQRPHLKGL
ncbi:methylenetetrahydrofolate reductase [Albibacillus kandeliae]|uniref:methylenetetrahydrofolate reductase n=1 Tax=Albibacillus kandeliae TaxID=2174228 RepID=UPI001E295127|nr:methylenetetrahydrofolate reductase [Albibacillus kandeliae]